MGWGWVRCGLDRHMGIYGREGREGREGDERRSDAV